MYSDGFSDELGNLSPYLISCMRGILKKKSHKTREVWTKIRLFFRTRIIHGIKYGDKSPNPSKSPFVTSIDSAM